MLKLYRILRLIDQVIHWAAILTLPPMIPLAILERTKPAFLKAHPVLYAPVIAAMIPGVLVQVMIHLSRKIAAMVDGTESLTDPKYLGILIHNEVLRYSVTARKRALAMLADLSKADLLSLDRETISTLRKDAKRDPNYRFVPVHVQELVGVKHP